MMLSAAPVALALVSLSGSPSAITADPASPSARTQQAADVPGHGDPCISTSVRSGALHPLKEPKCAGD
jgi:hypothetical protein